MLVAWAHARLPSFARHRADTVDVVEDAVVAALGRPESLDPENPGKVVRFLQRAILNRIRDEIRRGRLGEESSRGLETAVDSARSQIELLVEHEDRLRFRRALLRLAPEDQALIVGRVELRYPYSLLARATGLPSAEAARSATRRAILRLARITGDLTRPRPAIPRAGPGR
jgi:RNA polymerase sigma factor (sigma-70 family)